MPKLLDKIPRLDPRRYGIPTEKSLCTMDQREYIFFDDNRHPQVLARDSLKRTGGQRREVAERGEGMTRAAPGCGAYALKRHHLHRGSNDSRGDLVRRYRGPISLILDSSYLGCGSIDLNRGWISGDRELET